jgi:amidase
MSAFGVGSDLGSSVRNPAAWCGVFGLRPSRGMVSLDGYAGVGTPPAWGLFATLGPMARTAEDLELGLRAMAGMPLAAPKPGPFRVAVHEDDGLQPVASACRAAVRRAAEALAGHGHELVDAAPPAASEIRAHYDTMLSTELAHFLPGRVAGREDELSRYAREFLETPGGPLLRSR